MIPAAAATRSWLFVPGNDPRKMAKALTCDADVVIFDLEDAVAPQDKPTARALVAEALTHPARPLRFVRVNGLGTGLAAADVAATLPHAPDGYVLPKCEGPDDIATLSEMTGGRIGILAIATETVRAVRNLMRQDWAHPALTGLTWGGEDLAADLGSLSNRATDGSYRSLFVQARDLTLLAARDAGVLAIDSVFVDFHDTAGLNAETRDGFTLGFDGKMAIHPAQIDTIHTAMTPAPADVEWARRVIAALETAQSGVAQLDGKMLDLPHLISAHRLLRLAGSGTA
ncbi:CoA ester lyase [Rhodobacteraceae bacterium M382]|nr:CoA ester lyase [Rhodobacteraceae bacterium M382]